MIYINNTHPTHINYQDTEIKKLYLGNKIIYHSLRDKEVDTWEEYQIEQQGWSVDLNNQWVLSTVRQDANTNYQTYMSNSNKGVHSSIAKMKVNIAQGISTFTLHYGSYAESNYDYTCVGHLDMDMSNATSALTATSTTVSTSYWKASSRGSQSSSAPNLTATYTISDTSKEHFIWIAYRKDGSTHTSDDRGYVSFDKTLNTTVDGWRKIEYTYVPQEITPYVYKFFVGEQYIYSEDKETIIKRDPITATTTEIQPTFNEVEDTFIYERHIYKKKYYVVNGEQTEYYTFGEDMGEVSEDWIQLTRTTARDIPMQKFRIKLATTSQSYVFASFSKFPNQTGSGGAHYSGNAICISPEANQEIIGYDSKTYKIRSYGTLVSGTTDTYDFTFPYVIYFNGAETNAKVENIWYWGEL